VAQRWRWQQAFPGFTQKTAAVTIVVLLLASSATAQQFGQDAFAEKTASDQAQTLTFTSSLTGGYDQNLLVETIGVADPRFNEEGSYLGGGLGLAYAGHGGRIEGGVNGGTSMRFYRTADQFIAASYNGGGDISLRLTKRLKFSASGSADYSPYYQVSLYNDPIVIGRVRFDYRLAPNRIATYSARTGLSYQTGRWSSFDLDYGVSRSDFIGRDLDYSITSAGARYMRRLSQHASLRLGYALQQGTYGTGGLTPTAVDAHTIDVGVDWDRAHNIDRRTVFNLGFGSTAMNDGRGTTYQPTGHASLSRRLSQGWTFKAEYTRNLSFVDGYRNAFFADTVAVGALAHLSRKVTLLTQASYITGMVGRHTARVGTYAAGERLQTTVGRNLSLFAEAFYYRYRFAYGFEGRPSGDMNRITFVAGFQSSVPLLNERIHSATR
jgi:hypothetical protein